MAPENRKVYMVLYITFHLSASQVLVKCGWFCFGLLYPSYNLVFIYSFLISPFIIKIFGKKEEDFLVGKPSWGFDIFLSHYNLLIATCNIISPCSTYLVLIHFNFSCSIHCETHFFGSSYFLYDFIVTRTLHYPKKYSASLRN